MAEEQQTENGLVPRKRRAKWADDAPIHNAFQRGIIDAPLETVSRFVGNTAEVGGDAALGVGLGAQKFYYDGASAVNSLVGGVNTILTGQEHRPVFDMGTDYWDFMKREFDVEVDSQVTKGTADITALLLGIQTGSKLLGSIPKVATWMQSGSSAVQFGKAVFSAGAVGAAADLVHTRSGDQSLAQHIPEEYQNDFTRWLSNRGEDSELQGRMKNAIEGIVIGAFSDTILKGVGLLLKGKKLPASMAPELKAEAETMASTMTAADIPELNKVRSGRVVFSPEESARLSGKPPMAPNPLDSATRMTDSDRVVTGVNEAIVQVSELGTSIRNRLHLAHQSENIRHLVDNGTEDFNVGLQGLKKIIMDASDTATSEDALSLAEAVMTGGSGAGVKSIRRESAVGSLVNPVVKPNAYLIGKLSPEDARARLAQAASDKHEVLMKEREDAMEALKLHGTPLHKKTMATKFAQDMDVHAEVREAVDAKIMATGHAMLRAMTESKPAALKRATKVLSDPASTNSDRQIAKSVQDYFEETPKNKHRRGRLNPKTSGDALISQATRMAHLLKGTSVLSKKTVKHNADTIFEAVKKYSSGELSLQLKRFAKEHAYDLKSLTRQAAILDTIMGDGLAVLQVARKERHTLALTVQAHARLFVKDPNAMKSPEAMATFMNTLRQMDELDHGISGTLSNAGRMLQMQKYTPSQFGVLLDQARLAKDVGGEAPAPKTFGDYMAQMIMQEDTISVEAMMKQLATGAISPKELQKMLEGDKLIDFIKAGFLGSILSSVKTLTTTVLMGNVVQVGVKNVYVPFFEGLIAKGVKHAGGIDVGASPMDAILGARSIVESSSAAYTSVMKSTKGLQGWKDGLTTIGAAEREGVNSLSVLKRKDMKKRMDALGKRWARDGYSKSARLVDMVAPIHAAISGVQAINMRGISNIDAVSKHVVIDAELRLAAHKAWRKAGASAAFGDVNEEIFLREFGKIQRDMIDLHANSISNEMFTIGKKELFAETDPRLLELVDDSIRRAEKTSLEATLQEATSESAVGRWLNAADAWADSKGIAGQLSTLMLWPFRQAPINMVREVLAHTPIAGVKVAYEGLVGTKTVGADGIERLIKATPEETIHATAKIVAGTTMMAAVAMFVDTGRITGTIHEGDRADAEAAGRIQHSIYLEGKWYSYAKLGPIAALISASADYQRHRDKFPDSTKLSLFAMPLVAVQQESHLATMMELFEVMTSDEPIKDMSTFTIDKATQLITPLAGITTSLEDMLGENVKYRSRTDAELGGLYEELHAAFAKSQTGNAAWRGAMSASGVTDFDVDITSRGGEKQRYSKGIAGKMLNFLGISNNDADMRPSTTAMIEHGLVQSNMSAGTIDGVPLTRNEMKDMLSETFTDEFDDKLDEAVTSPQYASMGKQGQKAYIKAIKDGKMNLVKALRGQTDPAIRERVYQKFLFDLGRTVQQGDTDFTNDTYNLNAATRKRQSTFKFFQQHIQDK